MFIKLWIDLIIYEFSLNFLFEKHFFLRQRQN